MIPAFNPGQMNTQKATYTAFCFTCLQILCSCHMELATQKSTPCVNVGRSARKTVVQFVLIFFLAFAVPVLAGQVKQLPGDANCDGEVNVLDAIAIINYFMGGEPDPFCFENADVNQDGVINVLDAIGALNIFLDPPQPPPNPPLPPGHGHDDDQPAG